MANITICNFKGGVGKSLLAHQLITSFGYRGIEIDPYGSLADRLPERVEKVDITATTLPQVENTIFDFGGFDDRKLDLAIEQSGLILVPFIPTLESVQGTADTLLRIKGFEVPILLVANMVQKPEDVQDAKFVFEDLLQTELEIFQIPLSIAFQTAINENRSILELADQGGIKGFAYRKAKGILEELHSLIQSYTQIT